jgi:hypothetical protein
MILALKKNNIVFFFFGAIYIYIYSQQKKEAAKLKSKSYLEFSSYTSGLGIELCMHLQVCGIFWQAANKL